MRWGEESADELHRHLEDLASRVAGRWGFSVYEDGVAVAEVGAELVMPAASTIKVPLLISALRRVDRGELALAQRVNVPVERTGGTGVLRTLPSVTELELGEALELMVTVSDNTATNMVIDLVDLQSWAVEFVELGLSDTALRRRMLDERAMAEGHDNVTTAAEQAFLLERIASGALLTPDQRGVALGMLGRQQARDRLPAALPPDVECLHKTGEWPGVRHDVGLLDFDGRLVAVAALSSGLTDPVSQGMGAGPAAVLIADAARAVVELGRGDR